MRSVLTVTKADSLPESDSWIREKCNLDIDPPGSDSDESESDNDISDSDADIKQTKKKRKNVKKTGNKDAKTEGNVKVISPAKTGDVLRLEEDSLDSMSPAKKMKTSL